MNNFIIKIACFVNIYYVFSKNYINGFYIYILSHRKFREKKNSQNILDKL